MALYGSTFILSNDVYILYDNGNIYGMDPILILFSLRRGWRRHTMGGANGGGVFLSNQPSAKQNEELLSIQENEDLSRNFLKTFKDLKSFINCR